MKYLPHTPRNFREIVLADLLRAQRLIERINDEIDPQFRIASPEGDWWIGITLPDELSERKRYFDLVSDFMACKNSPAFVLASELAVPDAVYAIGVSHKEVLGALSLIQRKPVRFGAVQWLSEAQLGDELPGLLPRGRRELTNGRLAELDRFFGPNGKFPAVKIGNE